MLTAGCFQVEEGWWSGTMNGKSGLFPSNFVKEIETAEDTETSDVTDEPGIVQIILQNFDRACPYTKKTQLRPLFDLLLNT